VGPALARVAVKEALGFSEGAAATLAGNIARRLGSGNRIFRDKAGSINSDIGNRKREGRTAGPQGGARITGGLDRDWGSAEVGASAVKKFGN
jgi:uncharacterized protein (TIGR00156 family)